MIRLAALLLFIGTASAARAQTWRTAIYNDPPEFFWTNSASIRSNTAPVDVSTNTTFILATRYTNGPRRVFVAASIRLAAALTGKAQASLFVEHPGIVTNRLTISAGNLAAMTNICVLMLPVGPSGIYYFADEKTGSGAIVNVVTNTCSVTGL